jgi:hypothetical protein
MDAEPRPRCTGRTLGGEPCARSVRPGKTRCAQHDGRELRKAERKLNRLTVPAVERLEMLLLARNEGVALGAVKAILDRTAGPVPHAVALTDPGGIPSVQIGFALGGLIQAPAPTSGPLPAAPLSAEPAIETVALPELEEP